MVDNAAAEAVEDTNGIRQRGIKKPEDSKSETGGGDDGVNLKKEVGVVSGVALIVGTMIGSGIFISPTGVLSTTGSVGSSLCVWAGCGIISMLGALSYAELGTLIPKSGGEYAYFFDCFNPLHRVVGGIPAFLFSWVAIFVLKPSSFAVITLAFASYTVEPFFDACGPPQYIVKCVAVAAILTISLLNCWSVRIATIIQVFFTFAKLIAMVIITVGGFVWLFQGHTVNLTNAFEGTTTNPSLLALAFYDGLWAYDGWNNLNYVTEEIKNPKRNLPLCIGIAIPLVTVCYLLVNIAYFAVLSKAEMLASAAVAVGWSDKVLGNSFSWIIPLSVACSTFGAANGSAFTGARLCFAAAREGHLMDILSHVHIKKFTPVPSLLFNALIAIIMIIPGDIFTLIDFFSFTAWLFYGLAMVALIVLRFTMKDTPRPYKVPIPIPIIVLLISIYLVVAPIVQNPAIEFLYAFLFIVGGLIFYFPFVYKKWSIPGVGAFTAFMQLLMQVSPTTEEPTVG